MIVFKTEMEKMPSCCNDCNVKYGCRHAHLLNLNALKLTLHRASKCPLIEIPDPKPEPTLTQHEHDLISIIRNVYPDATHIGITKDDDSIYILTDVEIEMPLRVGGVRRYLYKEKIKINLFDKHKLQTLLSEFTNETSKKQYNINLLLSRPIRKENPNAETKI